MNLTLPIAVTGGALAGLGLVLIVYGLVPRRRTLAQAMTALTTPPSAPAAGTAGAAAASWAVRLGRPAARPLTALGLPGGRVRRDLRVLGRTPDQHLAEKVVLAVLGACLPPLIAGVWSLTGTPVPLAVPLWAALLGAFGGFLVPDLGIRGSAAQRRRDFEHALASYLDLVVVALAGGAALDGALSDAAANSHGWAFTQIRHALAAAQTTRDMPWQALDRLGADLDIAALRELAASISLAGTEGARVRTSLAAKAESLRQRQITGAEAAAHSATERMTLALVVLFAAFLLFVFYPGLALFLQIH